MARPLPLALGHEASRLPPRRARLAPALAECEADGSDGAPDPGSFLGEARPLLRVVAALSAIALAGFAAFLGVILALLGSP
ncbi:MAG: hypothetical protein JSR73_04280 [Proteobacteria bacterium]|nr:hypothetical protein [Pseudomonadota bacterium]